jgi:MFS family permease
VDPAINAVAAGTEDYPHWRRNRFSLQFSAFFQSIGFGISNPFLPLVLREMGVLDNLETWVGYLIGVYFTLSFVLTPVWGAVADHYGRKVMVLRTSIGMGIIYAVLPFTTSLPWFVVVFLLLGTTNGLIPSCQALIATTTPARLLPSSLALLQTGALVGGTLGPAVGAALAGWLPTYRDLFWVASAATLAAGLIALLFARENFVRPEGKLELHPVRDVGMLLRIPGVPALLMICLTYQLTYNGSVPVVSVYTLHLLEAAGMREPHQINTWVGVVSVALPIGSALAVPLWGRLLDRFGPSKLLPLCLGSGALGVVLLTAVFSPLQLAVTRLVLGMMAVGIGPAAIALVKGRAPAGMESRVLAFMTGCGMIGMGGGPLMAGIIGPLFGLRSYFALNCALLVLGYYLWRRATRPVAPSIG